MLLVLNVLTVSIIFSIIASLFYKTNNQFLAVTDFAMYYTGANMIRSGSREMLYDKVFQPKVASKILGVNERVLIAYRNLPPIALLFVPFSFFTLAASFKLFCLLNIGLLLLIVRIMVKFFKISNRPLFLLTTFFYMPVISLLITGQVTILFFLIILAIYKLLDRGANFWAGLLAPLMFCKPQYVFFLPFIFIISSNKVKFTKGFFLGVVLVTVISLYIVGTRGLLNYPRFLLETENYSYGAQPERFVTVASFFYFLNFPALYVYLANLTLYLFILLFFYRWQMFITYKNAFVAAIIFTIIFSIHIWIHDLTYLLIPMAFFLSKFEKVRKKDFIIMFFVMFLVPYLQYTKYPFLVSFVLLPVGVWVVRPELFMNKYSGLYKSRL